MRYRAVRKRFWMECVASSVAATLAILTIVWPDWIEVIFGVDPDAHSGMLEVAITLAATAVAVAVALFARAEWRHGDRLLSSEA